MNWEKFGSTASANIQKSMFHLLHELEKTENQTRTTITNANFQLTLDELVMN